MFEPERFQSRHIGPDAGERDAMLKVVGAPSMDALIDEAIPRRIRLPKPLDLPDGQSEYQFLRDLRGVAAKNQIRVRSSASATATPSRQRHPRNVLENPGWYTPYTPYQAEIAQGRLESLLNFQTMVSDLTGMEIANASLLDEATAAGEAMTMLHRVQSKKDSASPQCFVAVMLPADDRRFESAAELARDRARHRDWQTPHLAIAFGAVVQTPTRRPRARLARLHRACETGGRRCGGRPDL